MTSSVFLEFLLIDVAIYWTQHWYLPIFQFILGILKINVNFYIIPTYRYLFTSLLMNFYFLENPLEYINNAKFVFNFYFYINFGFLLIHIIK